MAISKPVIYKIPAFDTSELSQGVNIKFAVISDSDISQTLTETDITINVNSTQTLVGEYTNIAVNYESSSSSPDDNLYVFSFELPSNATLVNNNIYNIVNKISVSGTDYISDGVIFYCYATPYFTFRNYPEYNISSNSYQILLNYNQADGQNELLNWYKCNLYKFNNASFKGWWDLSSDYIINDILMYYKTVSGSKILYCVKALQNVPAETPITDDEYWEEYEFQNNDFSLVDFSVKLYDTNYSYEFNNLENNSLYYMDVEGQTVHDTLIGLDAGYVRRYFGISYEQILSSAAVILNNICSEGYIEVKTDAPTIPEEWDYRTISHVDIKRRIKGANNWLTLAQVAINTQNDFIFTHHDYLAINNTIYEYALVAVTISGTETAYNINEIKSYFNGVFITDGYISYDLKNSTNYSSASQKQITGIYETFGKQYPIVVSNSSVNYKQMRTSAYLIYSLLNGANQRINREEEVFYRDEFLAFLTDHSAKMLKDYNGNCWLISIIDEPGTEYLQELGNGVASVNFSWVELGSIYSQEDLNKSGLLPIYPIYSQGSGLKYDVTYNLTYLTTDGANQALFGDNYVANLSAMSGYYIPLSIIINVAGNTLVQGDDYIYNNLTGDISIDGSAINGAISISAVGVVATQYTLTINNNPNDYGSSTGGGSYYLGDDITLSALPISTCDFVNWTKNGTIISNENPYNYKMGRENITITANFEGKRYNVIFNLTNTTTNGLNTAKYDSDYTCILIPDYYCYLPTDIQITIGGIPVTSGIEYTYNNITGELSISGDYINGIIEVTCVALSRNVLVNNTWDEIKTAFDNNSAPSVWLGQSKDGYQLVDNTRNRYEKVDGSGYSNAVFESVDIYSMDYMNFQGTNAGGYNDTYVEALLNGSIYNSLNNDIKNVLSQVKVKSANGGGSGYSIIETNSYLFIPSLIEVAGSQIATNYAQGGTLEGSIYSYNNAIDIDVSRIKKYQNIARTYWLRSCSKDSTESYRTVGTNGRVSGGGTVASGTYGIVPCFAI